MKLANMLNKLKGFPIYAKLVTEYPNYNSTNITFVISEKMSLTNKELQDYIKTNNISGNLNVIFDGETVQDMIYDDDDELIIFVIE